MSEPAFNVYGKPTGDGPKAIPSLQRERAELDADVEKTASESTAVVKSENGKLHHRSTEYIEQSGVKLCGDFGGVMANGKPCTREAGHGINKELTGKCWLHTDAKLSDKEQAKREFIAIYSQQPMTTRMAAEKIGTTATTIWRWRKEDAAFDEEMRAVLSVVNDVRGAMIEDAAFMRAADPSTNADALRMYMLQNLLPGKYRDMRRVEHTGANGGPVTSVNHNVRWNIGGDSHFFFGTQPDEDRRDLADSAGDDEQ